MRRMLFLLPICCLSIFAFGQRDTLIIHEKGDFKILENQFFDKNDDLVKQAFLTEGDLPTSYFNKEDLFQIGIKLDSKRTIYGIGLDSIIIYNDGKIIEKRYFHGKDGNMFLEQHLYKYQDDGTLKNIKTTLKELMFFSRIAYSKSVISRLINPSPDDLKVKSVLGYYHKYGYDSLISYTQNGVLYKEYYAYFPNGQLRQKGYYTEDRFDSTVTFRHDGTLMEKGFSYEFDKRYIDGRIVQRYKPYEIRPYEIDTINFPSSSAASESKKTEKRKGSTFVADNKSLPQVKMSTVDTAFAISSRDSLFIYQRGDSKILEGRFYYKNGQLKKRVFESEGYILAKDVSQEDLFQRGLNYSDEKKLYARQLDSIIIYHSDGRTNEKWTKYKHRQDYVYVINNQYYVYKATTSFNANELITKSNYSTFVYSSIISNKQRIGENMTIPFELTSFVEELVMFEIISKNNIQFQNGQNVVNYGDTLRLDLECNAAKSRNNYDFILRGTTADTTYNLNITLNIDGYHLTQSDFENGITYELTGNNLVLYFENGGGKILKIYKNGVLEVEGSVPQIMNEISFKGYAKGEYTLELLNLSTGKKDKMTLILK